MSTTPIVLDEFSYQLYESRIMAYTVLLPLFVIIIAAIGIDGLSHNQYFVFIGLSWTAFLIAWCFIIFGLRYNWLEDAEDEVCTITIEVNGEDQPLNTCYCELYQTGGNNTDDISSLILQPSATVSNLSYTVAGLVVLYIASHPFQERKREHWLLTRFDDFVKRIRDNENPISSYNSQIALGYGLIALFISPASMIYHASIKQWAGLVDSSSILVWASFGLSYSICQTFLHNRLRDSNRFHFKTTRAFAAMFVCFSLAGLVGVIINEGGMIIYTIYIVVFALLEITVIVKEKQKQPLNGVKREAKFAFMTVFCFALALATWIPAGGVVIVRPFCPSYIPHALWHIFSSLSIIYLYLYYSTEQISEHYKPFVDRVIEVLEDAMGKTEKEPEENEEYDTFNESKPNWEVLTISQNLDTSMHDFSASRLNISFLD